MFAIVVGPRMTNVRSSANGAIGPETVFVCFVHDGFVSHVRPCPVVICVTCWYVPEPPAPTLVYRSAVRAPERFGTGSTAGLPPPIMADGRELGAAAAEEAALLGVGASTFEVAAWVLEGATVSEEMLKGVTGFGTLEVGTAFEETAGVGTASEDALGATEGSEVAL
jgi:hypothetical protein